MQPGNLSPEPAVNLSELLTRVDNDHELLCDLIDIFKGNFPGHLGLLREAVAQANVKNVEKTAHTLRGMLSSLAATRVASAAAQLEQLGRSGDIATLSSALALFESEAAGLTAELEGYQAKIRP